jgi:hypothetical protein
MRLPDPSFSTKILLSKVRLQGRLFYLSSLGDSLESRFPQRSERAASCTP